MMADVPRRCSGARRERRAAPRAGRPAYGQHDNQTTLLHAAHRVLSEDGADAVSSERVCAVAGLPTTVFESVFADRTDCLIALFDAAADGAQARMSAAYRSAETWVDAVRAANFELLSLLDQNPRLARFMVLSLLSGGSPMLARRERLLGQLAWALEAGRPPHAADASSAPFGAEALVGAVVAIIHSRLQEEPAPSLLELGGSLMAVLVLPYLGVEAARHELSRPVPFVRAAHDAWQLSEPCR